MPWAGYCTLCHRNVWLNSDGACPQGHDPGAICNAYVAELTQPSRPVRNQRPLGFAIGFVGLAVIALSFSPLLSKSYFMLGTAFVVASAYILRSPLRHFAAAAAAWMVASVPLTTVAFLMQTNATLAQARPIIRILHNSGYVGPLVAGVAVVVAAFMPTGKARAQSD